MGWSHISLLRRESVMKKLSLLVFALALIFSSAAMAAEQYVAGGFEASGHVVTGAGGQKYSKNATGIPWMTDGDTVTYQGVMGKYLNLPSNGNMTRFAFFVDEVELDLMKSFGENIRLRADLDFGRVASSGAGTVAAGFVLEQAYATANIPLGNGLEVLLGRFNAPMGLESVDVNDNDTISKSIIVRGLRPANMTGIKLYYEFSDAIDLHFYVVNSLLQDNSIQVKDVPSLGFRLGYNWGEMDTESTVGLSAFFGPEAQNATNRHYTFGGDLDLNWWITESFALGLEALFTRNNAPVAGQSNVHYMAGLLNLHYAFSDTWDGTLKYCYAKQFKVGAVGVASDLMHLNAPLVTIPVATAAQVHEISLAGNYYVADGAAVKMEGRFDIVMPKTLPKYYDYGLAMAFAYEF
ncbi:MAG: porin [Pseudomonadota bacterium]